MSAPATLPPPPAIRRPASECRPFALIYDALPNHAPATVQGAIDSLRMHRKRIDVASVMELVGRVPMPPVLTKPAEPPAMDEGEPARMARLAEHMTATSAARLRKSDFRARVAWAESLIASGADRIEASRPYLTIDGWGYSPRANRYESEDTWRFRLAELFAPTGGSEPCP